MEEYLVTYYVYFNFGNVYSTGSPVYCDMADISVEIKRIVVKKVNFYCLERYPYKTYQESGNHSFDIYNEDYF